MNGFTHAPRDQSRVEVFRCPSRRVRAGRRDLVGILSPAAAAAAALPLSRLIFSHETVYNGISRSPSEANRTDRDGDDRRTRSGPRGPPPLHMSGKRGGRVELSREDEIMVFCGRAGRMAEFGELLCSVTD